MTLKAWFQKLRFYIICCNVNSEPEESSKIDDDEIKILDEVVVLDIQDLDNKRITNLRGYDLYKCGNEECNYKASLGSIFKDHMSSCRFQADDGGKLFPCSHCEMKIKTLPSFMEHLKVHGVQKQKCSLCNFRCWVFTELTKHFKSVHKVNNYKWIKSSGSDPDFYLYPKEVANKLLKPQELKMNSFHYSSRIEYYYPSEIELISLQSQIFPWRGPQQSSTVHCALCSFETKVRCHLIRHLELHLRSDNDGGQTIGPLNPVPCLEKNEMMVTKMTNCAGSSHANKARRSSSDDTQKQNEERTSWRCALCKTFNSSWTDAKSHCQSDHKVNGQFMCSICQFTCDIVSEISTHVSGCSRGEALIMVMFLRNDAVSNEESPPLLPSPSVSSHPVLPLPPRDQLNNNNSSNQTSQIRPSPSQIYNQEREMREIREKELVKQIRINKEKEEEAEIKRISQEKARNCFLNKSRSGPSNSKPNNVPPPRIASNQIPAIPKHPAPAIDDRPRIAHFKTNQPLIVQQKLREEAEKNQLNKGISKKQSISSFTEEEKQEKLDRVRRKGVDRYNPALKYIEVSVESENPKSASKALQNGKDKKGRSSTEKEKEMEKEKRKNSDEEDDDGKSDNFQDLNSIDRSNLPLWRPNNILIKYIRGIYLNPGKRYRPTPIINTSKSCSSLSKLISSNNSSSTSISPPPATTRPGGNVIMYSCPKCTRYKSMNSHDMTVHLYNELHYQRFTCKLCPLRFVTLYSLKAHIETDHKVEYAEDLHLNLLPFNREIEEAVTKEIDNQTKQLRIPSQWEKEQEPRPNYDLNLSCKHCQHNFSSYHNYRIHLLAKHIASERYKCDYCQAGFWNPGLVKAHHNKSHVQDPPLPIMYSTDEQLEKMLTPEFWNTEYGIPLPITTNNNNKKKASAPITTTTIKRWCCC